jgi:hypothetical protein
VQNEALDELRTLRRGQAWTPEAAVLAGRVHDAALPVAAAAVEAGGRGASDLGAGPAPDPVSAERAEGLVEGMTEALEAAIIGAAATEDPAAEAGRKFRSWRNDEVGRWIRTAAYAGYHDGLVAGLAAAGIAEIVGVRHGRLCKDCPAAVGVVWDPAGSPPEGYASPPAHLDCGCAVQPHL